MKIESFDSNHLPLEVAKHVLSRIISKFVNQDRVIMAVSGGGTPKPVYEWLGKYIKSEEILDENRELHVIQVDERFVPGDSDRRNHLMIDKAFNCQKRPHIYFHHMPSKDEVGDVKEAAQLYSDRYADLIDNIDIIYLGVGPDGHFASLFPDNWDYIHSINADIHVLGTYVEAQREDRISLSPRIIQSVKEKILHFAGDDKADVFMAALHSDNTHKYPIKLVQDDTLLIFTDTTTAKKLEVKK